MLIVNQHDRYGGAARTAWDQFKGLKAMGFPVYMAVDQKNTSDPSVFTIPRSSPVQSSPARWIWAAAQAVKKYKGKIRGAGRLNWLLETVVFPRAEIERSRGWEETNFPGTYQITHLPPRPPDVVHLYNLHENYFDIRFLPTLSRQIPTVLTLADSWLLAGHCGQPLGCQRWMTGCGECPRLDLYPAIRTDGSAYNWQRKKEIYSRSRFFVVVLCQWMAEKVEKSILSPAAREVRVIPSGVDRNTFFPGDRMEARRMLGLPSDSRILLFVGQGAKANPFKDVETIETAFIETARQTNRSNLLLLCLGQEKQDKPTHHPNIQYHPFTHDDAKIARYYQAADILLHAAHEDTFPNVILEALSCGIPVIASAVGGIPEQIVDGQTGFLFPRSDSVELARRISFLLDHSDRCRQMGNQAAAYAREKYDLKLSLSRYVDFYSWCIDEHARGG